MKTIYKYPIQIADSQTIWIPSGAKNLHVGLDPQGDPCLWAAVDTNAPDRPVTILIIGTGNGIAANLEVGPHIGSFSQGTFMWHVFLG